DDMVAWQRILNAKGWAVVNWPAEWGGRDWSPVQQYIFLEELQQAPAPPPLGFGVNMVGPVIIAFGNEAQKKRYLPAIATLEHSGDKPLIEDERFRAKIAAVEVELKALEMTQLRVVAAERNRKDKKPDPASSILKIKGSEIQQTITELLVEVVGPYALPY